MRKERKQNRFAIFIREDANREGRPDGKPALYGEKDLSNGWVLNRK